MRPKTYKRLEALGCILICKICGKALGYYDEVESKVSGRGPKLYHAECYDEYQIASEYVEEDLRKIYKEEGREGLESVMWEFGVDAPEEMSDKELIAHILILEDKYRASNKNI